MVGDDRADAVAERLGRGVVPATSDVTGVFPSRVLLAAQDTSEVGDLPVSAVRGAPADLYRRESRSVTVAVPSARAGSGGADLARTVPVHSTGAENVSSSSAARST